ncbi:MAG TPA: 50S ribosomal protein L13 [Candidatus Eisenbacteria bacterium]|nr:50S ribosomal protein L13 [Candidatus Eisenbacteria bacterium]
MNTATPATKAKDIKREWQLVDVKGKVLGRVAVEIAHMLMGKKKPYFVRNLDCGDYVVVVNASQVAITGKKSTDKMYRHNSGYTSGLKEEAFKDLSARRPGEIIMHAVRGMLPQNKLRATMLKRLHVFAAEEHKYTDKFGKVQ